MTQEGQLDILKKDLEPLERQGYILTFYLECRTCHINEEFHSVKGARSFITNHRGHDTWIEYEVDWGGQVKPATRPIREYYFLLERGQLYKRQNNKSTDASEDERRAFEFGVSVGENPIKLEGYRRASGSRAELIKGEGT